VEELADGFAVYTDERGARTLRQRFDVCSEDDVAEGWEDNWRTFHHGVVVGRFWIGPPWEEQPAGVESVVIDPGRAFGTGAHPTTRLTLALLQEQRPGSLLDVGCGSGVLSVAAALLGFGPVVAVDVEAPSVEATRANASANGVALDVRLVGPGDPLPRADVVVANISLESVDALILRIDCGTLVTSGYLASADPALRGFEHVARRTLDGWACDVFRAT
jgi:ribosomal protein L11 methyltransferase